MGLSCLVRSGMWHVRVRSGSSVHRAARLPTVLMPQFCKAMHAASRSTYCSPKSSTYVCINAASLAAPLLPLAAPTPGAVTASGPAAPCTACRMTAPSAASAGPDSAGTGASCSSKTAVGHGNSSFVCR